MNKKRWVATHIENLKALFDEYEKTLSNKGKDEWYDTERGIWISQSQAFLEWLESQQRRAKAVAQKVVAQDAKKKGNKKS